MLRIINFQKKSRKKEETSEVNEFVISIRELNLSMGFEQGDIIFINIPL